LRIRRRALPRKSLSDRKNRHPELAKDLAPNYQARCFAALNMTVTYARKLKRKCASLFSERNLQAIGFFDEELASRTI